MRVKVTPADSDPEKIPALAAALNELSDEEPYIDAKWENGQKDITISTTGKIQLEVIDSLPTRKIQHGGDLCSTDSYI